MLTAGEVKEIQLVFAFEVLLYIYEQKQEKLPKLHDKAKVLYTEKVDMFIKDRSLYPSELFSANPSINKEILMAPTLSKKNGLKELDGKEIWRRAKQTQAEIIKKFLPLWNELTHNGSLVEQSGKTVHDILLRMLTYFAESKEKQTVNIEKDDPSNATEEINAVNIMSHTTCAPPHPIEWKTFLLYGPPTVYLYGRPIAEPFLLKCGPSAEDIDKKGIKYTSATGYKSHGRAAQRAKAAGDKRANENSESSNNDPAVPVQLELREIELAETSTRMQLFKTALELADDEDEKKKIKKQYKNYINTALNKENLLTNTTGIKRAHESSSDDNYESS